MTKEIVFLIQRVTIFISISTTAAAALGESCETFDGCTVPNSTCIETICQCFPSYAQVNATCVPSECGELDPILNGRVDLTYNDVTDAFVAEYECNDGYHLVGDSTRQCVPPDFDGKAPICELIECSSLDPLANGTIYYSEDPHTFGSNATFSCNDGFELSGAAFTTCLPSGEFENYTTTCDDIDECETPETNTCDSNASCTNTEGSFVCNCNSGFRGDGLVCEDINECNITVENNCDSNATCTNTPGSFICVCNAGFTGNGSVCTDINECDIPEANNCDVNATCTNIPGSFICVCNLGFTGNGSVCDDINECRNEDLNDCHGNATCQNVPGSFICACLPGFSGNGTVCNIDPPVMCRPNFTKMVYNDLNATAEDTTICLPKVDTLSGDICHNPSEPIVYQYEGIAFTEQENATHFCLTYKGDPVPIVCDTLTAYDGSTTDVSAATELCFLFNREPTFVGPSSLLVNVPDMGLEEVSALSASDLDLHQTVLVFITGVEPSLLTGIFSIQANALTILNPEDLIQDKTNATITVEVRDNGIPSLTATANITIQFTFEELSCSPSMDLFLVHLDPAPPSPSKIGQIDCVNISQSQGLMFSVQDIDGPFTISENGDIFYNESASSVIAGEFKANIEAQIQQPVYTTTSVTINFIVDNFSPSCTAQGNNVSKFNERDIAGSCSNVTYVCTEKAGVQETCSGMTDLFSITCNNVSPTRTEVNVCLKLDLITKYGTYIVQGNITNQYGSTPLTLNIEVANVNDPPIIQTNASSYNLSEMTVVGYEVARFTVTDPDIGYTPPLDNLTVTLAYADGSQGTLPFNVSLNDAKDQIFLVVSGTLNFVTKRLYSLRLTVLDTAGLSDFIILTVNILNVNEQPSCMEEKLDTAASVQDPPGSTVASLMCMDPDQDRLIYTLEGPINITSFFAVNGSGIVKIKVQLVNFTADNTVLRFKVKVADPDGLETKVNVSVAVGNSVPPQCPTSTYTTSKSEKTDNNVCFSVPTDCRDPVQNEALVFEFKGGNGTQLFRVEQTGDGNNDMRICTMISLQDNYGTWLINIAVKSSYGEREIRLIVSIIDQNDPPVFVNLPHILHVQENTPVGVTLYTIKAEDTDSGILGEVRYQSTSNDNEGLEDSKLFQLDRNTGVITVRSPIDAESSDIQLNYTFPVQAIDGDPQQPKSAVSTITFVIVDINDNPPVCVMNTDTVLVLLTLPVGRPIYQLNCTDKDRTPEYRQLQYTIVSDVQAFMVTENGTVILSQSLPRDVTQYKIPILVSDRNMLDNTSFSDKVEITVNVDTAIPPSCTPSELSRTFRETQAQGSCLDVEVKCTDPTGGELRVESATGSGVQLLEIRKATGSDFLGLNACTNTTLRGQFGTYELIGTVTNGFASTSIRWTFTVINVNDPPLFDRPVYNVSVKETVSSRTEILTLVVTDVDDTTVNDTFHLDEVTVELMNNGDFGDQLSDVFLYVKEAKTFFSTVTLNATTRNLYEYIATARDRSNLSSTAEVYINIEDVNSKPVCLPVFFQKNITILEVPGTIIQEVSCYDTDIDPLNKHLDYDILTGDPDGYFNVSETGAVMVQRQLPRTRLYGDRRASLVISVSDRGTPSQSTNVEVIITVDNSIQASCSPIVTPPDIWVIDKCVTVTMDCQDPTTEGTDHLVYTLNNNYTLGFREESNSKGTIVLCYKEVISAVYLLNVVVDNGLSRYSKDLVIEVSYEKATPVFNTTKYETDVAENADVNTEVLTVIATSQNLIGELIYRVLDSDSFDQWNLFFDLDPYSGIISTLDSIRALADQLIPLRIEAEDTGSKLKSSTQVEIKVTDINEAPTCLFSVESLALDVNVGLDTKIVEFSCTDLDTKPEFQQLTYELTGDIDYFSLENTASPTFIFVQQPLDVMTASYSLQLSVADSAGTPLSFERTFQISVSLLPPPVIVEAVSLKYDLIRVNWRYEREVYRNVTIFFKVVLRKIDNSEITSEDLPVNLKNYNMTRLKENTTYTVIVMANTRYGTTNSSAITLTTGEIPLLANFTGTVRIPNIEYTSDLRGDTQFYQRTKKTFLDSLDFVLKPTAGYAGADLKGFRDANSIYADFVVFVNQSGSISDTIEALNSSVRSGWLDSLSVDSSYFIVSEGDGYIIIDAIRQSSTVILNGTSLNLTCDIVKIGYPQSTVFEFWWTYNGNRISPTTLSRYTVTRADFSQFPEYSTLMLRIDPILDRNAGNYKCLAKVRDRQPTVEKLTIVSIVSQPRVTLTPDSQTVSVGDTVKVTCRVLSQQEYLQTFLWFKDGEPMEFTDGETISQIDPSMMTLTSPSIRNSTVFGCAGVNNAGTGQIALSYIGVLPEEVTDALLCENDTDSRGNFWLAAVPGTVSVLSCPQGYTGTITRSCLIDGDWQEPLYNCVRDAILSLASDVEDIQDGLSSANISYVLEQLAAETTDLDLLNGDIDVILDSLRSVNLIIGESFMSVDEARQDTDDMLQICSNMIADRNKKIWRTKIMQENIGAIDIPKVVEDFLGISSDFLDIPLGEPLKITRDYIYTEIGKDTRDQRPDSYKFPDGSGGLPSWAENRLTRINVPSNSFNGFQEVIYSGSFYRNITNILVKVLKRNGKIEDVSSTMDINSEIVSFSIVQNVQTLDPAATITFQHFDANYSNPICVFWDFTILAFSTDGCRLVSTSDDITTCECNHLTNFAVLMSPGKTPKADVLALSIISAVGCGISILCLFVTILLHLIVWRLVKSDRAALLMNLCVALIISYVLFLVGIDRAESEDVCTAISVLLHFFYLVVFFLMLAYGIEIAVSVIYVFVTRSRIRWLLPLAWGIPAVIVGVSIGVTKLDGYGNEEFCWLSIDSGLLWAFVGPAAFVILVNLVIVIAVFRKMFKSSAMMTKSDKEKAKTGVRSICVLLPILGLTWVFGVFSVNENLVVFQYIFTVCNSLQGFFILLFHCILNSQLRDALQHRSARKKSLASFENSYKNQHSTATSTSYHSDKTSKQNNTELEIPITVTNPFLEADRQMKEMVAKNKKGGHLQDNLTNNQVEKGKTSNSVDLDDVKISNILRESEVMGGTAGISSILQTQTTENEVDDGQIRQGESANVTPKATMGGDRNYNSSSNSGSDKQTQPLNPEGYEMLLQPQPAKGSSYEKLKMPYSQKISRSYDNVDAEIDRIMEREKEKEMEKERSRLKELEREKELEKQREIERQRQLEMEKQQQQREPDPLVITFGYEEESPRHPDLRGSRDSREGMYERVTPGQGKSSRSSRCDDDYEGSGQNISSIKTSLPVQYDNKRPQNLKEPPKKGDSKKKDKNKKKMPVKDRSKAYEYSYESTYMGGPSRHASLENMNMQQYGYSPYAQMQGMGGYQTGRPTHQQVHWDQYRYPQKRPHTRGDYW